ncbi:Chaperone protein dnaJ 16 [Acorus gramineus]|uniref:Chaperone protein dnaJ 16 n=1 Tax=Acorus gramineus TaxID=55184 RepID=A0AAV9BRM0_ACOGR|nr:Chaperone protein dnaJ 16 [Acorus gramineus]
MDRNGGGDYYAVLGICKSASPLEIRAAYGKLAMKWHPDRWAGNSTVVGEAKRRFQQVQEAYSVLSDKGKRAMCDVVLFDPFEDEDEGFLDFMQEMVSMMDGVESVEDSFEGLQRMFVEMVGEEADVARPKPSDASSKGTRVSVASR